MSLTFGELFAGVGGFSLGFEQAGWRCRWQVEWDKHCQQVLARHWPEVARYGDVRDVAGGDVPFQGRALHASNPDGQSLYIDVGQTARSVLLPVDCITFGSPCQDLSVAGKRAGLAGERSGLFHEAIRIIKEMRDATAGALPRFAIWENVAGALSSNKGDDFLAVLDAFAEVGSVDISWRLVDAQHFGVAQRRRRVFVVADFGGECAGSIHAEPAGVRWHPAARREARAGTTAGTRAGVEGICSSLSASFGDGGPDAAHAEAGWLVPNVFDNGSESRATVLAFSAGNSSESRSVAITEDGTPPLRAGASGTNQVPTLLIRPSTVRRLTPLECERLMGWPDEHTRYRADGTEQSESQRYRQCGNGVVAPVAAWLAWNLRISLQEEQQ